MRRIVGIAVAVALVVAVFVGLSLLSRGGEDDGAYRVRAQFNNAFALTQDTEVRVAGVRVGTVEELDVDSSSKAVVIMNISEPGFQDFRRDASCIIRPQSLIGERFVECRLTRPRMEGGSPAPPELRTAEFDGQEQRVLPVSNTSSPIDLDLVFNVNRLPQAQRFQLILSELGTGLAGRNGDIRDAVRSAAPALKEADEVLKLLGNQNSELRRLATDGDTAVRPLARERRRLQSFVREAGGVATATAERRGDLETNIRELPATLAQIRPTMREIERLSSQATPALADITASAAPTRQLLSSLQPFSRAAIRPLEDLGDTADLGRVVLRESRPTINRLETLGARLEPLAGDLRELLESADENGVLEGFSRFAYYQTMAVNGFDSAGHYLRAHLLAEAPECALYSVEENSCSAGFGGPPPEEAEARSRSTRADGDETPSYDRRRDPRLVIADQVARGAALETVLDQFEDEPGYRDVVEGMRERLEEYEKDQREKRSASRSGEKGTEGPAIRPPGDLLPGDQGATRQEQAEEASRPRSDATPAEREQATERAAQDGMLDYLLGDGS